MRNKVLPTNINLDSANILTVMVCFFIRAGPPSLAENECKQTMREVGDWAETNSACCRG